ncbi:unnamed protein product, partial [Rotaria socialis]
DEITKVDVSIITSLEKPSITLAAAEKLQHDAAIELKDDDDAIKLDLTSAKIPITIENVPSTENEVLTLEHKPIANSQSIDSNIKSKLIKKKKKIESLSSIENSQKLITSDKSKSIDKQTITLDDQISSKSEKQNSSQDNVSDLQKLHDKIEKEQPAS